MFVALLATASCFLACKVSAWSPTSTRRRFIVSAGTTTVQLGVIFPAFAAASTEAILEDLKLSKEKISQIPDLLDAQEWDKVRSILKVPPVNKLWNLGDSQNIVLTLAKETDNIELIEMKDELALSLQMCDQLTYDNAFVYFQPGNGKVKINEPKSLAKAAMKQIQEIIDMGL